MEIFRVKLVNFVAISLLISSLVVYTTQTQQAIQKPQSITFFEGNGCSGQNETFKNSANFTLSSWQFANSSSVITLGTWYAHGHVKNKDEFQYFDHPLLSKGENLSYRCSPLLTGDEVTVVYYLSIQRNGPEDMAKPEIMFYSDQHFKGEITSVNEKTSELSLESAKIVNSYIFSGVRNWTIFSDTNFRGEQSCLVVDYVVEYSGYGLTYKNIDANLTVGSVRLGCKNDFVPTTPTTTTTTSKASTVNIIKNNLSFFIFIVIITNYNSIQ